jgi:hypothetical protein
VYTLILINADNSEDISVILLTIINVTCLPKITSNHKN